MFDWLKARLGEVSSWKGISVLATIFGLHIGPDVIPTLTSTYGIVAQCIVAVIAAWKIIKAEVTKDGKPILGE